MKLTMKLWRIYVSQIPNGMGNKKKVVEDKFDEVVPGTSGITKERLPILMGLKGGKAKESPKAPQEGSVKAPSQSEMSGQVSPSKGSRRRKARAGRLVSPSSAKNLEGPSDTPDAHASDPEASPTPQRKRTRRTITSSPPPP
ncbi:hypothetical protein V6N13_064640 [Hibiscus sabdariffa]